MNLTLITYAVAAALSFGAGFGAAWKWQASNITKMELSDANSRISAARASRAQAEQRIAQISAATAKAQAMANASAADRVRADAAGGGLRDTTVAAVRSADSDPAACPERARTLGVVFDQCVQAYIGVAEAADRWATEAVKQHEAGQ